MRTTNSTASSAGSLERRPDITPAVPRRLLPVGSDQARSVARRRTPLARSFAPQVRVLNYSGSGIETTFTQGEDACLASLVPELPAAHASRAAFAARRRRAGRRGRGPVASACSRSWALRTSHFLPPRHADRVAGGRARTRAFCSRSRSSPTRRARSRSAARRALPAPFPLGVEGTTAVAPGRRRRVRRAAGAVRRGRPAPAAERGRAARSRATAAQLAGKRVFFFPDSQLEIPLARFLARELGDGAGRGRHAVPAPAAPRGGTRRCCPPARRSAKARTSTGSSTAAAQRARTSSSAASASPIRSKPRA